MIEQPWLPLDVLAKHVKRKRRTMYADVRKGLLKASNVSGVRGMIVRLDRANAYISKKYFGRVSPIQEHELVALGVITASHWCRSLHHDSAHLISSAGTASCGVTVPLGSRWVPATDGDGHRKCTRCMGREAK